MKKQEFPIDNVIDILEKQIEKLDVPVKTLVAMQKGNPFKVLLSTIISLRTKDEVTIEASKRIYKLLSRPEDIENTTHKQIEQAIYPCGFYKRKSIQIVQICKLLIKEYKSKIPNEIDTLIKLPGIGRKTANLILSEGFGIPAMCVDVHVHRISNRFGYIKTTTPEETEETLRKILPIKHWNNYNYLLVGFGQSICKPISPKCTQCPLIKHCKRIGVEKYR